MYRIGIDLGGTNIAAGVVNDAFEIVGRAKCKTAMPRPLGRSSGIWPRWPGWLWKMRAWRWKTSRMWGWAAPAPATRTPALSNMPTTCSSTGCRCGTIFLPCWTAKPFSSRMTPMPRRWARLWPGRPRALKAACASHWAPASGGGIIIDGKIYGGFNFAGAELGHTVIMVDGEPCTCGRLAAGRPTLPPRL